MAEMTGPDEFLYAKYTNPDCPEDIPVPRSEVPQPQPVYGPVLDLRCPRCGYRLLADVRYLREYQRPERPQAEHER
jgi:hypothetical protein